MPAAISPDMSATDKTANAQPLEEKLGHSFGRPELLRAALTHPSAAERKQQSYERLEFLGDRVLGLIVADLLMTRFPREPEGALARRLAALVRKETLAEVAETLDLGRDMILAKPEREAGEQNNPGLLSDVLEAGVGALYLDGGLDAARRFLEPLWAPLLEADRTPPQDAKTALQEWAQARGLPLPAYREIGREGPPHDPVFNVEVEVAETGQESGTGRSKRLAEQAAATSLLARLRG